MRPAEHTDDCRDVLKNALTSFVVHAKEDSDLELVDAIESLIDAKLSEQSSHAAKGEREGGDTKWWDGPRISAHEAAEDMKREAVVNAARHLHDAMVNGGGADTVKDAGEILGEALADYDEESDAACNCNPLEQTGGGHRGDCPAYEPECTCYEMTGGHQPMCPYGAAIRSKAEQHGGGREAFVQCLCVRDKGKSIVTPDCPVHGSQSPAPDGDGGEDPSVTAEYARCGPVSHEEAEDIAQRYIDRAFNNKDKPRPLHCIPANPRTDSDIRLHAYIQQQRRRERDSAEALGMAEAERDDAQDLLGRIRAALEIGPGDELLQIQTVKKSYANVGEAWVEQRIRAEKAEARLAAALVELRSVQEAIKPDGVSMAAAGGLIAIAVDRVVAILDPEAEARAREGR